MNETITWLLASNEPWTRYRTMVDLLGLPEDDAEVQAARKEMVSHPLIENLISRTTNWPGYSLKRHNDAKHPIFIFSTLADFGLRISDPGISKSIELVMDHQSKEGAFMTQVLIPTRFGGSGEDTWTWILCDSPTLLYSLLAMGLKEDKRIIKAVHHLTSLVDENGYRCVASPDLGKFKGPGRKKDPCPIANVYALKALSLVPHIVDKELILTSSEVLLRHWELQGEKKYFLFGIGTDFRKLKYPFIWYDILHVVEVLSRFKFLKNDPRLLTMVSEITKQTNMDGQYKATSMYMAWKGWSFADKKNPSPWITFLVERIRKRII
jgi:hypothetical protein